MSGFDGVQSPLGWLCTSIKLEALHIISRIIIPLASTIVSCILPLPISKNASGFDFRFSAIRYKTSCVSLCIPNRGKLGVRAIINYNFDDLVEKNLKRLRVKYHSIYGEGMIPDADELGIYHVHGFLPQEKENYENLTKSLLVFSEEGYHKLMLEPYNWANISQLNYMINNTCLFIGLSMTDPNMRRLLEIAAQKRTENDSDCQHYAIMRRFRMKESAEVDSIKSFERVNETLQESFFKELGVNVIWIDEFSEIPAILKQIKGNYESY